MGGGGHKGHQSFTVTPASGHTVTADILTADTLTADTPPDTASVGADEVELYDDDDVVEEDLLTAELLAKLPDAPAGLDPSAISASDPDDPGPHIVDPTDPDDPMDGADGDLPPGGDDLIPAPSGVVADDALTPVPAALAAGDPAGLALLVGGADLIDSTVTLMAYNSTGGPREMLVATISEEAEAKLLEALALSETKMVPVEVQTEIFGRLSTDSEHQLFEQLAKVARSINHHLKAGDGIPEHTTANLAKLTAQLAALSQTGNAEGDTAMLDHYQTAAAALAERTAPGWSLPYHQGGKMPTVEAYQAAGMLKVTQYVPAPADAAAHGQLATAVRDATRPLPTMSAEGTVSWDGVTRTKPVKGKEYVVDLGDGYAATYRPYGANDPAKSEYSLRGALEIVAPKGAGHAAQLVERLGQLNLVNRPMTAAEGEWAYLNRNIWAQDLGRHPAVGTALGDAKGLEDAVEQVIFAQRAHEAIGMDDHGLHRLAKQIRLDAETKALPEKVKLLRHGVATACGHPDAAALISSPGYQPLPRRGRAGLAWERFDVTGSPDTLRTAFAGKGLTHHVTAGNIADPFRTGMLASTEKRALMGIKAGKGMSENADKMTGGAASVFLRVGTKTSHGATLYWDDPTAILARADWYAYSSDHFGAVNPAGSHSVSGQTRNPAKVAGFNANSSNEVMVRHGLDLLGAEAPSLVRCANAQQRHQVLAVLAAKGVTHLAGRPVEQVIH